MQPAIWSTDDLRGAPALRRWREVIDRSLFRLDISSAADGFHARLEQGALGPALMSKLIAGPQSVKRTPRDIAGTRDRPKLDIIAVRAGRFLYRQNGHEDVLHPGDCVLLDRSAPYRFEATESCSMTLALDHDWLARWTSEPAALAGRRIDGASGWGLALSTMLATLEVDMADRLVLPGSLVAEQIAGLLLLACAPEGEPPRARRPLEVRLRDLIADQAHDPAFDVTRAAALLGISRRSLHLLCARSGESFGRRLMAQRLERARGMLADPRVRLPVGEIAWRCGFLDQGHFAKRFRARFGVAPSALRA
ncbi:MAG: AraC family transcriptional regulator [Sphingomonadales bacterium]|nr:AraC family transcriptional regulator [Sphingomonadales bacterium]